MYVLFKELGTWKITTRDNYYSIIRDNAKVNSFRGFDNPNDVIQYLENYTNIERKNIKIMEE